MTVLTFCALHGRALPGCEVVRILSNTDGLAPVAPTLAPCVHESW